MIKIIFGSEDSLDIDVMYFTDKLPTIENCKKFCSENKLENRNLAVVKNGIISEVFKGTVDEVNNMLLDTYGLHSQEYDCPVIQKVERDIPIKCIRAIRGILSVLSKTSYRTEIKKALQSNWSKRLEVVEEIDFRTLSSEEFVKESKENVIKLIAFQLGQTMALLNGNELYTKKSIASIYPELRPYLYRKEDSFLELEEFKRKFLEKMKEFKIKETGNIIEFLDYNQAYEIKHEKKIKKDL